MQRRRRVVVVPELDDEDGYLILEGLNVVLISPWLLSELTKE
jgi:hypothetical protein